WSLPNIFNIQPSETIFVASDVGWVVGHTYIVYAPLIGGASTVVDEGKQGGTPEAGGVWGVASDHKAEGSIKATRADQQIRAACDVVVLGDALRPGNLRGGARC